MDYYKTNFNLLSSKFIDISLTELNSMLPFEREIYIQLYMAELDKIEKAQNGR